MMEKAKGYMLNFGIIQEGNNGNEGILQFIADAWNMQQKEAKIVEEEVLKDTLDKVRRSGRRKHQKMI